ncbi:MAG: GMC family oxidoreductase N-terminal domain-containing protein [Albidovulum sp.]|nr:GMC family oxidoreductase N-terminal domain-containing protein [Albidovulum sp.]
MDYDYIIAGGGSSACVAATRLVRDFGARVLLIERGPARTNWLLRMPAGYMKYLARDDFLEMHETVPQEQLDGRAPIVPQARALGGGSAVNAMVYMRGQRQDYDGWDAFLGGGSGWSYGDMLPHFKRLERNTKFNNEYHGIDGGLWVSDPGYTAEMTEAFVLAAQGRGFAYNPDFNGECQAGVGLMQNTIGRHERCDAVRAFLSRVRDSPCLKIITKAQVTRIVIENGRAVGVEFSKNGNSTTVRTGGEVLVATGTYNTAKLLMLSGIGPPDHLKEHGIACIADLPGVGENLQDHHEVPLICATSGSVGYFRQDRGWRMIRNGLQYLMFRSGPVTTIGVEACAFHDPDGGERPTIQLYCAPIVYLDRDFTDLKPTNGVTLTSCLLRPKARGTVRLRSGNPNDKPLVDCRFFGHPEDLRLTIKAVRIAREVLATEPAASLISEELLPGKDVASDDGLRNYSNRTVKTNYHPVGTARMGADNDPNAVVDTELRVRGIENLRVVDCSVMPFIPSGNTNAPAMAVADRAVSIMRK